MAEYGVFKVTETTPLTLELVQRGFKDIKACRRKLRESGLVGPGVKYYVLKLIGALTYVVGETLTIVESTWEPTG